MTPKLFTNALCTIACMVLALTSCKKDATTPPPPPKKTNTELLTTAPWKISMFELKKADGTWISVPLTAFQKTIVTTYKADGTFSTSAASNTGGTSTTTGTWKFTNNETTIVTYDANNTASVLNIMVLSETLLSEKGYEGSYPYLNADGTITQYYGDRFSWSH